MGFMPRVACPDQDVRNEGVKDRTVDSHRKSSDFPASSRDLGHTLPNPFPYLTHLTLLFQFHSVRSRHTRIPRPEIGTFSHKL